VSASSPLVISIDGIRKVDARPRSIIPPHALRGTHASLAMTAGATGDHVDVAAALDHESFTTTECRHSTPARTPSRTRSSSRLCGN
jgi:integrase